GGGGHPGLGRADARPSVVVLAPAPSRRVCPDAARRVRVGTQRPPRPGESQGRRAVLAAAVTELAEEVPAPAPPRAVGPDATGEVTRGRDRSPATGESRRTEHVLLADRTGLPPAAPSPAVPGVVGTDRAHGLTA